MLKRKKSSEAVDDMENTFDVISPLVNDKAEVSVFLMNGVRLEGVIMKQNDDLIFLSGIRKEEQIVFKHAISTISYVKQQAAG